MAGIPLNTFRTIPHVVQNTPPPGNFVYQAPLGVTSIILLAQVANIGVNYPTVTFTHYQYSSGTYTELVSGIVVPPNDSLVLLGGKFVLETNDQIYIYGSATDTSLKFIASVLETANQ